MWGLVTLAVAAAVVLGGAVALVTGVRSNGIAKDTPQEAAVAVSRALMGQSSVTAMFDENLNESGVSVDLGGSVVLTNDHSFSVSPVVHISTAQVGLGNDGVSKTDVKIINQLGASGVLTLRYVGGSLYVRIPSFSQLSSLISQIPTTSLSKADAAVLATLGGKWISFGPATAPSSSSMAEFSPQRILNLVKKSIGPDSKAFSIEGAGTVDGQSVVKLSSGKGGAVYVAAGGPALPLRVVAVNAEGTLTVNFTYGSAAAISAPASSINLSTIEKALSSGTIPSSDVSSVNSLLTWFGSYDATPRSLGLLELIAPIEQASSGVISGDQTSVAGVTALSTAYDAVAIGAASDTPATYGNLETALSETSGAALNTATTTSGASTTDSSAVLGSAEIVVGGTCVIVKFTGQVNGTPKVSGACSGG
jgi:hypothetical protein